ncbi:uncharacterized protein METZ01_LOCUS403510, partial [marine metagenome]
PNNSFEFASISLLREYLTENVNDKRSKLINRVVLITQSFL